MRGVRTLSNDRDATVQRADRLGAKGKEQMMLVHCRKREEMVEAEEI